MVNYQNRPSSHGAKHKNHNKPNKNTLERMRNVKQPETTVEQLL